MEYVIVVFIILVVVSLLVTATQQRYTGPGEKADNRNREEFGDPVKSLYTSTEVLTFHHRIEVTDETGKVVYRAETKFPSILDKTDIYTQDGRHVSYFERKLFSIHEIHYVDMELGIKPGVDSPGFYYDKAQNYICRLAGDHSRDSMS